MKKIVFSLLIFIVLTSVAILSMSHIILDLWWIYSLNIIETLIKLLLIRWFSIPIFGLFFTLLSFIHLISASEKEYKNKKILFLKTSVVFVVMCITEQHIQLYQSLLNIFLGGNTNVHDPLFNLDFSVYLFIIPLLQKTATMFSIFLTTLLTMRFMANIHYKVDHLHLFDRLLLFFLALCATTLSLINRIDSIHHSAQNYIGYMDLYGNLFPFALSVFAILLFLFLQIFNPHKKLTLISLMLTLLFIVGANVFWPWYLKEIIYTPNQSSLQEKFAGLHAESTRRSFGLQNISYDSTNLIKKEDLEKNLRKNFWHDERHFLQVIQQNQEILPIFKLNQVNPILLSNHEGEFSPYLISARESSSDPSELWDIKFFRNIFGYGAVIGAAHEFNQEGFAKLVLQNLTLDTNSINIPIKNPYILFSEEYETPAIINTSMVMPNFKDEDFSLEQLQFDNVNGIPVNLFTRLLLTIIHRDTRFLLTEYFLPNSLFLYQRKPRALAKNILPQFEYSHPILQYHNQEFWWEMDAYIMSDSIYLSKSIETPWGKFNWLQSPMKVFISAYSGEVIFDVLEPQNPYVRIAQKLYPQLFDKKINLPIEQYSYPREMFNIQGNLLQTYHETNAASFYSQINQRETSYLDDSETSFSYKMIVDENKIALQQIYNPSEKNILSALFSAHIDNDKQKSLSMYNAPSGSGIPGISQATAFLNQNPEFSQKSTLWGQGGSKISRSRMIFYPLEDGGIYANSIYLESENNSIPLVAQFATINKTTVSLGSSTEQVIHNTLQNIQGNTASISYEQVLKNHLQDAYQLYLLAEQARINENTQEYREYVDKIGVVLQSINRNESNK